MADLFRFYARFHRRWYGWDGIPVHDAVAVGHVIDPALLTTRPAAVIVDTGPELSRGRTHVDLWGRSGWPPPNAAVATDIDAGRFLDLVLERIPRLG